MNLKSRASWAESSWRWHTSCGPYQNLADVDALIHSLPHIHNSLCSIAIFEIKLCVVCTQDITLTPLRDNRISAWLLTTASSRCVSAYLALRGIHNVYSKSAAQGFLGKKFTAIRQQLWALSNLRKSTVQGFLCRKLMVIYGNSAVAVGLIETMVPELSGQKVNGNILE